MIKGILNGVNFSQGLRNQAVFFCQLFFGSVNFVLCQCYCTNEETTYYKTPNFHGAKIMDLLGSEKLNVSLFSIRWLEIVNSLGMLNYILNFYEMGLLFGCDKLFAMMKYGYVC